MRTRFAMLRRAGTLKPQQQLFLSGILGNVSSLKAAYDAKEAFYDIWDLQDRAEAEETYRKWVRDLPEAMATPFKKTTTAMRNWHPEIFAYFDHRVTNAYTEAANGVLKIANRLGRGYSFPVIRARVIHKPKNLPKPTAKKPDVVLFTCESCLSEYPETVAFRSRRLGKTVCANCHRLHTLEWFTHQ